MTLLKINLGTFNLERAERQKQKRHRVSEVKRRWQSVLDTQLLGHKEARYPKETKRRTA